MTEQQIIAELATEYWKLHRAFERMSRDLPTERLGKVAAQLRYSNSRLESLLIDAGLRLVTFDSEEFSAELPVSPVNAEDIDGAKKSFVESTVEPSIIADGAPIRVGKVILRGE